ncbi:MAG: hypothetical protein SOH99_07610 [Acidipropionibacterium acidipropionici]|jgi:hypothetical protein|uniref:Integral membrane protein n=1 Tax=Acidipropionibacterium acidipropionici (strain ATCC 4875 / DSM 20272 / JCM 6432 / NBRC 12425 / NCIMB 8070 / 4) TaxID=1171373 RepID=K7RVW8_ACIA4|nr:hypothetical protein [Acidipropionibacterium acidipropionici]AFV89133.1 hypothetical protein PACID_13120 [Acidipropionibacterium acidipropionici ATCC 4875]ALN16298.1 hypothetical protein ASQ49_14635 [Acidipropionibacterium acidipropionici]APZ07954.1 hypothetical protein BWX38_00240 [Acidipropionibacterium acidipropionici]MDN6555995.1 hypothetical protein [Acidipropionibacterium acidipropionici]QCV95338.1 hypothetical protein FEZ30_08745 [Acidipropionibacterium acidipropionici]
MASSSVPKNPEINRSEMEAVLGARAELGEEMEPAVVDSFAARVTSEINRQMALERAEKSRPPAPDKGSVSANQRVAVAIVSAGVAIPLTAIMMGTGGGIFGSLIVWIGLVAINMVLGFRR